MPEPVVELEITRLGRQGDGLGVVDGAQVAVAGALPGERVRAAAADGKYSRLLEILHPSVDRVVPSCPHFGPCGGCRLQHFSAPQVAEFKRKLVNEALERAGVMVPVAPVLGAHGRGRRRITLHAGQAGAGFNQRRSSLIQPIDRCPILVPELDAALEIARAIFKVTGPCDVGLTAVDNGLDVGVRIVGGERGGGKDRGKVGRKDGGMRKRAPRPRPGGSSRTLPETMLEAWGDGLVSVGQSFGLARLSLSGELVWQAAAPEILIGRARVPLPTGGFLQASALGGDVLSNLVGEGVGGAKRVADLFSGVGTFALRLAENARVFACDSHAKSMGALEAGWRTASGLHQIKTEVRDLFNDPLEERELQHYDAVVLDPPRAGAKAQAICLAGSGVPTIVSVSCDPISFARDAAILCAGGYDLKWVRPVDQFEHSVHVEIVGLFNRVAHSG